MLSSIIKATAILALVRTATSWALPGTFNHDAPAGLKVPWKERGLYSGSAVKSVAKRDEKGYSTGCNHGPAARSCWKDNYDVDTDMDLEWPTTGNVVKYHFEITNVTMAPDGFERPMQVFNGQYPGPTIEADWGDEIEVTITNHLENNGTGVHWHGLRQLGSNEMDGTNGLTECPIVPGGTKVYRFKATQYGTSWYHSHYSVQYGDGLIGPIIIHGPATGDYDLDLGVLPFTDWFHATTFTVNAATLHAKGPPTADNLLVNGSMTSTSGGQYAVTTLSPGKTHLLRLVNMGINNWVHVGIDGHPFTVIAADFVPIEPFQATSLSIAVGQRYDVIINATQPVGNYWLRVGTGGACDGPNANAANIGSIIHYAGAENAYPNSTAAAPLPAGCYDEVIVPYVKTNVPQDVPEELKLTFTDTGGKNGSDLVQWRVNDVPMLVNFDTPTLQAVLNGFTGNEKWGKTENVIQVGSSGHSWQYWVIQQDNAAVPAVPHPIHLHGHDFYVLEQKENAVWNGDISTLTMNNPIRRDTATLPALGYLVLAFESDNPGVWLMHCHTPFHVSAGLGVQFVEGKDEILKSNGNLDAMQQGCTDWQKFQKEYHPNGVLIEGDSGL
ncbi:laccase [Lizonia empirigonia]|nr:laccase [Lizonia empirigonia]